MNKTAVERLEPVTAREATDAAQRLAEPLFWLVLLVAMTTWIGAIAYGLVALGERLL